MNKRDRYSNFSRDFASSKNTEAINLFLKFLEKEKDYAKNNIEEVIEIVKGVSAMDYWLALVFISGLLYYLIKRDENDDQ